MASTGRNKAYGRSTARRELQIENGLRGYATLSNVESVAFAAAFGPSA